MFRTVRDWLERTFAPKTPSPREQGQRTTTTCRQDRAGTIVDLRTEVRRLQQEIKDVTDSLDGLAGDARTAHEGRLASLHRELEQKQRELGGFQARV